MAKDFTPTYYLAPDNGMIISMMRNAGYRREEAIRKADIVLWTGGADISPYFYGEKRHPSTFVDFNRDLADIRMLRSCASSKFQAKVGICRGAQFLNVLVGNGTLWQHVNGHSNGYHDLIKRGDTTVRIRASSTHHQMMLPGQDGSVLWTAAEATKFEADTWEIDLEESKTDPENAAEVILYPDDFTLCFQPHPEFNDPANSACRELFFDLLDDYVLDENAIAARMRHVTARLEAAKKEKGGK